MANPPAGYVKDPNTIDWWFNPAGDPAQPSTWWQCPPDGFEPDPSNPGWYLRTGGDPQNKGDWWHDATVQDTPSTEPTVALVPGIDISNAQGADVSGYIAKAQARHVVCKLYQTVEVRGGRDHAKAQMASAIQNGASAGGYVWLYQSIPVQQQVNDALSLVAEAGLTIPVLWLDVETYTDGSCPSAAQVREALDYTRSLGQRVGIYTGLYVWRDHLGSADYSGELLWSANYNHIPTLESTPGYGGMVVVAHQYNDRANDGSPLDVDVFDASVV